jgi:arsenate reductase
MTDATVYHHQDLSVDQQLALRTAATRLAREFDGTYAAETIERFPRTSYDQFADVSSVPNLLPLPARLPRHLTSPTTTVTRRMSTSVSRSNTR